MKTPDGSDLKTPPRPDEVEISVFGPGFGESVLVHLTDGQWIIVDSCLNRYTKEPAALDYLDEIGVNLSTNVRLIVSTHWHDDHVRGIAKAFEKCESAEFWCAAGLRNEQFLKLVGLHSSHFPAGGSGLQEFNDVLSLLKKRKKGQFVGPRFALEGTILYQANLSFGALVKALSPSSEAVTASIAKFSEKLMPKEGERRSAVPSVGPNDLAIVLTVKIGEASVLLGADLEELGEHGAGWQAIIERFSQVDNSHQGLKVSHHGSKTGHHDEIWPKLLTKDPWAVLTPYLRGKDPLPARTDVERICSLSPEAYITAKSSTAKYNHPNPAVRRQLREMGVTLIEGYSRQGHIRLRRGANDPAGDWTLEMFGDACRLRELLGSN